MIACHAADPLHPLNDPGWQLASERAVADRAAVLLAVAAEMLEGLAGHRDAGTGDPIDGERCRLSRLAEHTSAGVYALLRLGGLTAPDFSSLDGRPDGWGWADVLRDVARLDDEAFAEVLAAHARADAVAAAAPSKGERPRDAFGPDYTPVGHVETRPDGTRWRRGEYGWSFVDAGDADGTDEEAADADEPLLVGGTR